MFGRCSRSNGSRSNTRKRDRSDSGQLGSEIKRGCTVQTGSENRSRSRSSMGSDIEIASDSSESPAREKSSRNPLNFNGKNESGNSSCKSVEEVQEKQFIASGMYSDGAEIWSPIEHITLRFNFIKSSKLEAQIKEREQRAKETASLARHRHLSKFRATGTSIAREGENKSYSC